MSDPKFTPGPWVCETGLGCKAIKGNKRGAHRQGQYTDIAHTVGLSDEAADLANATLIAESPAMYEALAAIQQRANERHGGATNLAMERDTVYAMYNIATAALAKARGDGG